MSGADSSVEAYIELPCYVAGSAVRGERAHVVHDPYTEAAVGQVGMVGAAERERAVEAALAGGPPLSRYERHAILDQARQLLEAQAEAFAQLIRRESGLCMRETRYEVGRAAEGLRLAAIEALHDDGQVFSGDISAQGKSRKIYTMREPLTMALAISPFNHPLNQVMHKVAPAIAAGTPLILKPSERTPLTAIRFAELLYEAGLPGWMLSVLVGPHEEVTEPLIRDARIEAVSFTGSVRVGKRIAETAGYKKLCLELGGNEPLMILDDADMELAVKLAAEGCFRNSGQRCTGVKRVLVHEKLHDAFIERFAERAATYRCGDPADPETHIGTVISEAAACELEQHVHDAVQRGARVVCGGNRHGAQMEPTVIADVPRDAPLVCEEAFGPLAPVLKVRDLDDAIELANATAYGLATGVVTESLTAAIETIKRVRTGTVNVNEVPGYRIESTPFGGVKDSGLGVKEGIVEATRFLSNVKTYSLPW